MAAANAQLGFVFDNDIQRVKILSETHNNLFICPVVLQGKVPLKFILDTGIRNTILTEKEIGDLMGLSYTKKYTIRGAGGEGVIEAFVAPNVRMDMTGVTGRGHSILVLEQDRIELSSFLGTPVHGMFGYEIFSRFIVEFRYNRDFIRLIKAESFEAPKRFTAIPISIEDTKPYIYAHVRYDNGTQHTLKLLVDTGASHGIMLDPNSDNKVVIPSKTIDATIGRGLGGNIEGQIGRIEKLTIGDYSLEDVVVSFPYKGSYTDSLTASNVFRHGSIGGDIMSRFSVFFDYPNEIMYLKKNWSFNKEFYYNPSGITIKAIGNDLDEFVIAEVRKSSNAIDAGVMQGDKVLMINGYKTEEMALSEINTVINRKPGKTISLRLKRGEEIFSTKFKLKSPI